MDARRTTGEDSSDSSKNRRDRFWQFPLLLLSLGLFGYAAYLFINPKPRLTVAQRIDRDEALLHNDRPDTARADLLQILAPGKLTPENEARARLLLARVIDAEQRQKNLSTASNYGQIIQHTKAAVSLGAKPDADDYRRLGESYEALDRNADALESYRRAVALDPNRSPKLRRKVIELQLEKGDNTAAEAGLDDYLKDAAVHGAVTAAERGWAMGQKSKLLADRGAFAEARALLAEALKLDTDPAAQGEVYYRLGYCAWKLGEAAEAERLLRLAREHLGIGHPLDADAAQLLGRILQDHGDYASAISFFQQVIVSHPDSSAGPLARLGRGVSRIASGQDDAGLSDLHDLVIEIAAKPSRARYKPEVVAGLRQAQSALASRGNYQGALELMALEQMLTPEPAAEFFGRLATLYEKRSAQVEKSAPDAPTDAEQARRARQARDLLSKAGDASIALSRGLTVSDDQGHAEALWRGIDLYDRAGDMGRVISALEVFVSENPGDGQTPDAYLRLGRAYQAAGLFDKAIAAFQHNQFRYPQSLAASRSGVPLAQAFIAKGPESYSRAESALLATLNSPLITPEAEEFRDALFELAQLYYRTARYEEAVGRLEELTQRYPREERMGQLLFLMADSYRKSADLLKVAAGSAGSSGANTPTDIAPAGGGAAAAANPPPVSVAGGALSPVGGEPVTPASQAETAAAKRDRLNKARDLYDRTIERFRVQPPVRDLDKLYLKLAHFYRADCLYDNGNYEEAIRLYDAAALRYQDDPSALAAYVQIVNSYNALGRKDEAKAANERAKWLLRKMSPEAFRDVRLALPKSYWDDWLKWTDGAGGW